jgi:hypothetical protein
LPLGLVVPKQHSTGGKERLGSITKQGNRYLRWLLVAGAMAVIRYARQHGTKRAWLTRIMDRRPAKVAAGQQDRTNGLGDHGSQRAVQRTEAVAGSVNTPIGEGMTT